jgi:hypothetical protein
MKIPKTIKLGLRTYRIKEVDQVRLQDGTIVAGTFCASTLTLEIDRNLHPLIKWETLVHEVLHMVLEYTSLDQDPIGVNEEELVSRVTPVLSEALFSLLAAQLKAGGKKRR